ncbi:MAG: 5-formyltetrahydrofolate cyclo-ligase [Proteobacteria bacterium]|nr:5-formyltetrahydrofolate cyclo-ligase [Pseudomonadota bacterium]
MRTLKQQLRSQVRAHRRILSTSEKEKAALLITHRLFQHSTFKKAQKIALYLPFDGEVPTYLILQMALIAHKSCYAPVLDNKQLNFVKIDELTPLKANRFGILEPHYPLMRKIAAPSLDMVLLPLVAFDRACHRLGMGGGFYDKTFAFKVRRPKPLLFGLAYDFQRVEHLPRGQLDLLLDGVITEKHLYLRTEI